MNILICPEEIKTVDTYNSIKVFLAGGIFGCRDWQSEVIDKLKKSINKETPVTILNPRRPYFDVKDTNIQEEQVIWEYKYLEQSDIISFWFSKETLNPITLYELGKWGNSTNKPICIGIEVGYEKANDVLIQTLLARKNIQIVFTLEDHIKNILNLIDTKLYTYEDFTL